MSSQDALQVYLEDHMAGSVAASDLARRGADNNQGPLATFYTGLLREITADRRTLDQIATSTGTQPSALKQTAAVAAERLSRFKIDHRMTGNPDLSLLLELELLYLGIEGKHSLWRSLDALNDSRLAEFDFGKLAARAREQLAAVEEQRLRAAASALSARPPARRSLPACVRAQMIRLWPPCMRRQFNAGRIRCRAARIARIITGPAGSQAVFPDGS